MWAALLLFSALWGSLVPAQAEPGLILTPSSVNLDEVGASKQYTLQMAEGCTPCTGDGCGTNSECIGNLLLSTGAGSNQFTFTPDILRWLANTWSDVQTVTVTPVNNNIQDAVTDFSVQHLVVNQLGQPLFDAVSLAVSITDDDVAKLIVDAPSSLVAVEGGVSVAVGVKLGTEPVEDVTVTFAVAGSEVTISPSAVATFTSSNWNTTQSVSLAVSNNAAAASQRLLQRLVTITSASTDPNYNRVSEVQQVKLSGASQIGGTVTLTFNSYTTAAIAVSATGTAIQSALEALDSVHSVTVSAGANAENGYTWLVTFAQNSGNLPNLIVTTGAMTGSSPAAAVSTITSGIPPYSPEFSGEFLISIIDDDLKVTITSITAANTGNQPGPGNGDSMTLVFSEDTNRPAVATKANLDALFAFSTTIGADYTGEWLVVDVPGAATMTVTQGSTSVTAATDVTQELEAGDELILNDVAYTVASASISGGTAQSPISTVVLTSAYTGTTTTVATARMRSRSQLVVTLADTSAITSFPDMQVGVLQVTIRSTGTLTDRYSASTPGSSSTTVALGTWGPLEAPTIASAVASNNGNVAGMSNNDRLVITYDSATDRAGYASSTLTKAQVDALFTFTADGSEVSLGSDYTAVWDSDTQLRITLVNVAGAASQRLTRVGKLTVTAKAGNNVKSFDATSSESTGSATLTGDWGAQSAPTIDSVVAADSTTTPAAGISLTDTMTITFSGPTSMPSAASKADIANWLSFSANVGSTYTGVWQNDGTILVITLNDLAGKSTEDLTAVGTLTATVTALLKSADESSSVSSAAQTLSGTWGARAAPTIDSAVASDPGAVVSGLSTSDEVLITFNVDVDTAALASATVTQLFDFTAPDTTGTVWDVTTTAKATGSWVNARQYRIVVGADTAGVDYSATRVDHMIVGARASGLIKTLDGSSDAATATATLTGTWGAHAAVQVSAAVASDGGGQSGLGSGDVLTIDFDKETDRAPGTSEASVTQLLSFSASIGNTLTATWSSRTRLVVTVVSDAGKGSVLDTRIGTLTVTINAGGDLRSADRSSPAATDTSGTTGTWGAYAAPAITAAAAVDPVSNLASAGFTAGDTIVIDMDIATNEAVATSMTKSQLDTLLTFSNGGTSVSLGADYTGRWTTAQQLTITLVDITGADVGRTTIGALRVTYLAPGNLLSQDLSSPASTSTALLTGTWGDFPPPAIASVTAADGGSNAGLGDGDTLTIVFDQDTNKASMGDALTQANVDTLLQFSTTIGTAYTAAWTAADTLVITITTADAATPPQDTAVGTLYCQVQQAAGLKSADESSASSTSVGFVDLGTWGARSAPALASVTASDAGVNQGIGHNDQVAIVWDVPTSQVSDAEVQTVRTYASSGASVGGSFQLTYRGVATASIDKSASAADMQTALQALPPIGTGGVTVTRDVAASATGGYTWTVTFNAACRYGTGDLSALVPITTSLLGTGAAIEVLEVTRGNSLTAATLATLVTFSSSLGAVTSAAWASATTLIATLDDASGASPTDTRIGVLTTSILSGGDLRTSDRSSPPSAAAAQAVAGTWGAHSAPVISLAVATDASPLQAGIGAGDQLRITFDKETSQPAATGSGAAGVASLFTLSSSLGADYSGAWASSTEYIITITDATGADIRNTRVGTLTVTAAGDIRSADLSSSASNSARTTSGSWGDHSKPTLVSAVAQDLAPVVAGLSDADVVDVTFDQDTNQPSSLPATLFTLSSPLGASVTGAWTSASVYRITVASATGADTAATRVGFLTVTARTDAVIKSADESSPAADGTQTLSGSWGDHAAPSIVSAVAADGGSQPGVGVGDTLDITFDMDVNRAAAASETPVTGLVSPSASLGAGLSGSWTSVRTLRITITDDTGKGSITATQVGVMTVSILAGGNLQSSDLSSPVSTASATISGDWGAFPSPQISAAIASDPVSSAATAGLSPGDQLTITFSMDTNTPAVGTTAAIDALLSFSATMGTRYNGTWATSSVLVIDFYDTGGSNVVDTRVNHLTVTVNAAANLRSSDGSSDASTSSATVTGSWGPFSKPTIVSMTAADGTPNQGGVGDGDTITVVFDSATSTPTLADTAAINSLFTFNAAVGSAMTASWLAADRLLITITTVHPDAATTNAADTRVGGLFVKLNSGANLQSADLSSPAADGFGYLDAGTWGVRAPPAISAAVAADTANNEGIAVGDTFTVNFDSPTSGYADDAVQTVTTSATATIGGTFRLIYKGYTTDSIPSAASDAVLAAALHALPPIGAGGVTVTRSTNDAAVGSYIWTVTFGTACRMCAGEVPTLGTSSALTGTAAVVDAASVSTGNTLTKARLDALLALGNSLGASYTGVWTSSAASALLVTLHDLTGAAHVSLTTPGVLSVGVQSSAGLVAADRSSTAAAGSVTLSGTWGQHSAPTVTAVVAADGGSAPGLNAGDTVTITFNKDTNQATAFTDLITINPSSLGRTLTFNWVLPSRLVVLVGNDNGAALHPSVTRIGVVQAVVHAAGNLRSADLTSPQTTATEDITGTWGDFPPPTIVSATAIDSVPNTPGIAAGDTIRVVFDMITNRPDVSTAGALAALLNFSAPVGTFSASWADDSTLDLLVTGVEPGDETPALTRVGLLELSMAPSNPLRSADLSSPEGIGSAVLGGSYGTQLPPILVSAVASDDGGAPGLNSGDTLLLTFDKSTNMAPDAGAGLVNLINFTAVVGPVSGTWISRRDLRITFLDTSGRDPPQDVVAGVLGVHVRLVGGLRSADESSTNGTGTAVITGSFGAYPAPGLTSVVAADAGGQEGIGVGDTYTLTFDVETNAPSDSTALGQLVRFSADPGALSFTWLSATQLRITITSQVAADPPHLTRVGLLEIAVRSDATYSLKSADQSSPGADTAAVLQGTYGPHTPPQLLSVTAADTGAAAGQNEGDTVLVTFNKPTNVPALGGSALGPTVQQQRVESLFSFSDNLGVSYYGTWNTVVLGATATVALGSTTVMATTPVQGSVASTGSTIRIGTFDTTIVSFSNSSVFTIADAYPGASGTGVQLYGESRTTAMITLTNVTGVDKYVHVVVPQYHVLTPASCARARYRTLTRVGRWRLAARQAAGVRSSDLTSEPSVDEATLGGTWGNHGQPQVVSAVAADIDQEPGVGAGEAGLSTYDTVTITFDQDTNMLPAESTALVNNMLNFSASIGTSYVGTWLNTRAPGFATPVVGSSVLTVSEDLRDVLMRGQQFRVGLTLLQVSLTGTFSATSVPLAWPWPDATVSLTAPVDRRLLQPSPRHLQSLARRLNTAADTLNLQRFIYTASPAVLKLVVLDNTGAAPPEQLAPGVLLVGARLLRSADESSLPIDDVQPVGGSWNPAPIILAATATHGRVNEISHDLDVLDFVLIVFNVETSTPSIGNKTEVDAVFSFSASIGADVTGSWLNPSVAKLTVQDATGAASAADIRAGTLLVQVREGAGLTTKIGDSGSSLSAAAVVGLWGSELQPELVALTAVNGNNGTGVAAGDVLNFVFDRDTNMPTVHPTPEVQQVTLTSTPVQDVQVVALTGGGITGFFSLSFALPDTNDYSVVSEPIATTAVATRAEEFGGAYGLGLEESMQSRLEAMAGIGTVTVTSRINGATGGKEWTITFDTLAGNVPVLQLATSDLSFPVAASGLGAGVEIRTQNQGVTLGGYVRLSLDGEATSNIPATADDATVAAALAGIPSVGAVEAAVFPIGLGGSVAWMITFSSNIGQVSQLAIATDALTGDQATVSVSTIVNGVTSAGRLETMFNTSTPLPEAVSASWTSGTTLAVTLHQGTFTDAQAAALATLRASVREELAVVRSAGGTVPAFGGGLLTALSGGLAIGGSFGARDSPQIVTAEAVDAAGTEGLTTGDTLVVTFDRDTNTPAVATVNEVDRVLAMSAAIGCSYTGVWSTPSVLTVTVADGACASGAATAAGVMTITVRGAEANLRTADYTSAASTSSAVLSGSWGSVATPTIVSVMALDALDAPAEGLTNGDRVAFEFSHAVQHPWVQGNRTQVDALVAFSHTLGSSYRGEFEWESTVGEATLSADRTHLLLANTTFMPLLGPGTAVRFGGQHAELAAAPTAYVVGGALWPLSTEQLGNPATLSRLWRSSTMGMLALRSPLTAPVVGCDASASRACSLPLFTRSRTRLVVTVDDVAGSTVGGAPLYAELGASMPTTLRAADGSTPPVSGNVRVMGSFGEAEQKDWWELWWVWLVIVLLVVLCLLIPFCTKWLCKRYICFHRNEEMGRQIEIYDKPSQRPVSYNGLGPAGGKQGYNDDFGQQGAFLDGRPADNGPVAVAPPPLPGQGPLTPLRGSSTDPFAPRSTQLARGAVDAMRRPTRRRDRRAQSDRGDSAARSAARAIADNQRRRRRRRRRPRTAASDTSDARSVNSSQEPSNSATMVASSETQYPGYPQAGYALPPE